jgi:hypothetical protein
MCSAMHAILYLDTTTTLRTATQPDDILQQYNYRRTWSSKNKIWSPCSFSRALHFDRLSLILLTSALAGGFCSVTHAIVYITQIRQICYTLEHYQTLYLTLFSINLLGNTTLNFLLSANSYTFLAYYHF